MGWALLAISLALAAASCRAGMRLLGSTGIDRFWIRVLIVPTHLGIAAIVTSAFGSFSAVPFLLAQALCTATLWALWLRFGPEPQAPSPAPARARVDPACLIMKILMMLLIVASLVHGLWLPLFGFDERMYHASRVAYWLQNQSVFFFETHNDRQVSFPFGAELFFAWPLLFVKSELLAHAFHWSAVPAATFGVWAVCRAIGLGRRACLAGALVYASTPTVLYLGSALKSDIWLPLYMLGAVYFVLQPRSTDRETYRGFLLAGAMFALAMNVKMTAMALGPGLALAAALAPNLYQAIRRCFALAVGTAICTCLCGLGFMIVSNLIHFGRPLGPAWISKAVQPDYGAKQICVHAARTFIYLLELPEIPSEGLRAKIEKRGTELAHFIRADYPLAHENNPDWPGIFVYRATHTATHYSLWGLLWLPTLAIGVLVIARELRRSRAPPFLSRPALLIAMQIPVFLGVVFLIRWMGDGPSRFWLGAFVLAIPVGAWNIERWSARSSAIGGIAFLAITWTALATLRGNLFRLDWFVLHPLTPEHIDGRMHEVIPLMPPGSRILLAAPDNMRDYGLFCPTEGFANQVYPWGQRAFDAARADQIVEDRRITHVVIEHDESVAFLWSGAVDTRPMVEWIRSRADFEEVPVKTPHVRLFRAITARPSPG